MNVFIIVWFVKMQMVVMDAANRGVYRIQAVYPASVCVVKNRFVRVIAVIKVLWFVIVLHVPAGMSL